MLRMGLREVASTRNGGSSILSHDATSDLINRFEAFDEADIDSRDSAIRRTHLACTAAGEHGNPSG